MRVRCFAHLRHALRVSSDRAVIAAAAAHAVEAVAAGDVVHLGARLAPEVHVADGRHLRGLYQPARRTRATRGCQGQRC